MIALMPRNDKAKYMPPENLNYLNNLNILPVIAVANDSEPVNLMTHYKTQFRQKFRQQIIQEKWV